MKRYFNQNQTNEELFVSLLNSHQLNREFLTDIEYHIGVPKLIDAKDRTHNTRVTLTPKNNNGGVHGQVDILYNRCNLDKLLGGIKLPYSKMVNMVVGIVVDVLNSHGIDLRGQIKNISDPCYLDSARGYGCWIIPEDDSLWFYNRVFISADYNTQSINDLIQDDIVLTYLPNGDLWLNDKAYPEALIDKLSKTNTLTVHDCYNSTLYHTIEEDMLDKRVNICIPNKDGKTFTAYSAYRIYQELSNYKVGDKLDAKLCVLLSMTYSNILFGEGNAATLSDKATIIYNGIATATEAIKYYHVGRGENILVIDMSNNSQSKLIIGEIVISYGSVT